MVLGDVQAFVVDEDVLDETGRPSAIAMAPVSKLGGNDWAGLGEVFLEPRPVAPDLSRPPGPGRRPVSARSGGYP